MPREPVTRCRCRQPKPLPIEESEYEGLFLIPLETTHAVICDKCGGIIRDWTKGKAE